MDLSLAIVNHIITRNMVVRVYRHNHFIGEKLLDIREYIIKSNFKKRFRNIIQRYSQLPAPDNTIERDAPIWVFWGQGEEAMPIIVKRCYESICRNAGKHTVNLITFQNMNQFIKIPNYIMKSLEEKVISMAAFSDILRFSLLSEYGGIWCDATVFLTDLFPEEMYFHSFYSVKHPAIEGNVRLEPSRCSWRIFFMGSCEGNLMMSCCRDLWYQYVKEFDYLIDYFLTDYFIRIIYEEINYVKSYIDNIKMSDMVFYELHQNLNKVFSVDIFNRIKSHSYLHKMSYRGDFVTKTENSEITFYEVLISEGKYNDFD